MVTDLPSKTAVNSESAKHALQVVHSLHTDWVTQLLPVPSLGLCVSASLDGSLCAFDANGRVAWHVHLHRAAHCVSFSRHACVDHALTMC